MQEQHSGAAGGEEHPRLLKLREWVDAAGVRWRMRGNELAAKQARRLLARPEVRVVHVDSHVPQEVDGARLRDLLNRLEASWAGTGSATSDFLIGEFRNADHEVLVVVQESC